MFHKKSFIKIMSFMMCFVIFFSFCNSTFASGQPATGEQSEFAKFFKEVQSFIAGIIVSTGDNVVHIVATALGEVVTIDKLIFNDVDKVSVDYWDDTSGLSGNDKAIKNVMSGTIRKWYNVFNGIALTVYMVVLVYIGISIMLSSTGEKRAKYQELSVTWFMGIAILLLFPYVMKYIVIMNDAVVNVLQEKSSEMGYGEPSGTGRNLAQMDFDEVSHLYGEYEFGNLLGANGDMMVMTRQAAIGDVDAGDDPQLALSFVYLILVGQMLIVLFLYYKRAFMIAFLILIFPLVAMTYVLDKLGDGKNQSFGIWFKEFTVNIVVQMFHAVVYVLVTGAGIRAYIDSGGKNFIFMILCVIFLFEGEKILRSIFSLKSKANTIGDLAASGAMVMAMAKNSGNLLKRDSADMGSAQDKEENAAAKNRIKSKTKMQEDNEKVALEALNDKTANGLSTDSFGEYQGKGKEPKGVSTPKYDGENARDKVLTETMKRRLKGGIATRAISFSAGAVGAAMESSRVLADGYDKPGEVIGAIAGGKSLGKTLATPITKGVNTLERIHAGRKIAKKIGSGKMDNTLGITNIGIPQIQPTLSAGNPNINANQISEADGIKMQDVYRKALEAQAKAAALGGKAKGEIAYFKYLEKHLKK